MHVLPPRRVHHAGGRSWPRIIVADDPLQGGTSRDYTLERLGTGTYKGTFADTWVVDHYTTGAAYSILLGMRSQNDDNTALVPSDDFRFSYSEKNRVGFKINVSHQDNGLSVGHPGGVRVDFVCIRDQIVFCSGAFNGFSGIKFY